MSAAVLDDVRQTVAEVFFVDAQQVSADSSPESISAWDSMGHLNLVLAMEQKFGMTFDPDQIPQLTSVQAIAEAVAAKIE
ncbi:MAG: acyl carrier protein [Planctomycetes bacterium]|nr:acyl carrier protein [Planctomycetota bacterium]